MASEEPISKRPRTLDEIETAKINENRAKHGLPPIATYEENLRRVNEKRAKEGLRPHHPLGPEQDPMWVKIALASAVVLITIIVLLTYGLN
jgi:hypothetical protein